MATLIEQHNEYYKKSYILLEIIKAAQGREMSVLPYKNKEETPELDEFKKGVPIRNITAWSLEALSSNFSAFQFYKKAYKLYISLATFQKGTLPLFSFNFKARKQQQKEFIGNFIENPKDYLAGYDFAIDLDCKEFKEGYENAKKIKEVMDEYQLPYTINPSGGKEGGWHIRIPYKHFESLIAPIDMPKFSFKATTNIEDVDMVQGQDKSLYDLRRIFKSPMSLVLGDKNKKWNVCMPLTDQELENYNPKQIQLPTDSGRLKYKDKVLCERKFNLNGMKDFIRDYGEREL